WDAPYNVTARVPAQPFAQCILSSHARSASWPKLFSLRNQPVSVPGWTINLGLNRDLRTNLHHAAGGNLEEVSGIACRPRQRNEQVILPRRHARLCRGLERTTRQEKRCRHDVELPSVFTRDRQRLRHVGLFHVAEFQRDPGEML